MPYLEDVSFPNLQAAHPDFYPSGLLSGLSLYDCSLVSIWVYQIAVYVQQYEGLKAIFGSLQSLSMLALLNGSCGRGIDPYLVGHTLYYSARKGGLLSYAQEQVRIVSSKHGQAWTRTDCSCLLVVVELDPYE